MNAKQICAIFAFFFVCRCFSDTSLCLFLCIRQYGTQPCGGSLLREEISDLLKIFSGGGIHIHAAAAVGVQINKSGNHVFSAGIIDLTVPDPFLRIKKTGDLPVLYAQILSFHPPFFQSVNIASRNPGFHFYPSSPATNSVIFRLISGCS